MQCLILFTPHVLLQVQNADDNIYPENVEPTLIFILQETGIIVLNNERGFSSKNIRALCDVGNSTKKGSGTGYIGQKGIGFKSVFRVCPMYRLTDLACLIYNFFRTLVVYYFAFCISFCYIELSFLLQVTTLFRGSHQEGHLAKMLSICFCVGWVLHHWFFTHAICPADWDEVR